MGKIWLKSVDPNHQCCGCEGKFGPCDSCSCNYGYPFIGTQTDLAAATALMAANKPTYQNCTYSTIQGITPTTNTSINITNNVATFGLTCLIPDHIFFYANFFNIPYKTNLVFQAAVTVGSPAIRIRLYFPDGTIFFDFFNNISFFPLTINNIPAGCYFLYIDTLLFVGSTLTISMTNTDGSSINFSVIRYAYYKDMTHTTTDLFLCS